MADLPTSGYLGSALGNVLGTGGSNSSTAANATFQVGQYQPYSVNSPLGQTSFSGGQANTTQSPLQSQLSGLFGNQISSNLSNPATSQYNPNTSFLPQQYQSIFGNMQGNVSSMFNSLQQAQQPYTQQYLQSNLDNEQAKGTLASTAGSYQTAGAQTAANSQMNSNMAQAQQYALQNASTQFGAASSTANLGEQQAEAAPTIAGQQNTADYSNLLNSASLLNQQTSLGGSLGALQSNANTSAAQNNFTAAQQQDQAQSGLLNGLLTGNGTGGLLSALFGTSAGSTSGGVLGGLGSSAGSFINSLFGGGTVNGSAAQTGQLQGTTQLNANQLAGQVGQDTSQAAQSALSGLGNLDNTNLLSPYGPDSSSNGTGETSTGDDYNWDALFPSAGGQAATQSLSSLTDSELSNIYGSAAANPFSTIGSAAGLAGSAMSGSSLGMAGGAAGLAGALGAPSSLTSAAQTGVGLAGLGMNLAQSNILGAIGSAAGLGGKAGIPSYITQPVGLITSALMGNPIGIATNGAGILKGLYNMTQGNSYAGLTPSQQLGQSADSAADSAVDDLTSQANAQLASYVPQDTQAAQLAVASQSAGQSYDSSVYMAENSGNYQFTQGIGFDPSGVASPDEMLQQQIQSQLQQLSASGDTAGYLALLKQTS